MQAPNETNLPISQPSDLNPSNPTIVSPASLQPGAPPALQQPETPAIPAPATAESRALVPATQVLPPVPPLITLKPPKPLPRNFAVGTIDLRTPVEDAEFVECESLLRQSSGQYVPMGEGLSRIKKKNLYKNEYRSFELYCLERWGIRSFEARRYMAAAEVHNTLALIPGLPLPECEAQARPLTGLTADLMQQAWLEALSRAREGYVSSKLVKRVVKKLVKPLPQAEPGEPKAPRQQRYRLRQSVRTALKEAIELLFNNAQRDTIAAKIQEAERALDELFKPAKKKA